MRGRCHSALQLESHEFQGISEKEKEKGKEGKREVWRGVRSRDVSECRYHRVTRVLYHSGVTPSHSLQRSRAPTVPHPMTVVSVRGDDTGVSSGTLEGKERDGTGRRSPPTVLDRRRGVDSRSIGVWSDDTPDFFGYGTTDVQEFTHLTSSRRFESE